MNEYLKLHLPLNCELGRLWYTQLMYHFPQKFVKCLKMHDVLEDLGSTQL